MKNSSTEPSQDSPTITKKKTLSCVSDLQTSLGTPYRTIDVWRTQTPVPKWRLTIVLEILGSKLRSAKTHFGLRLIPIYWFLRRVILRKALKLRSLVEHELELVLRLAVDGTLQEGASKRDDFGVALARLAILKPHYIFQSDFDAYPFEKTASDESSFAHNREDMKKYDDEFKKFFSHQKEDAVEKLRTEFWRCQEFIKKFIGIDDQAEYAWARGKRPACPTFQPII